MAEREVIVCGWFIDGRGNAPVRRVAMIVENGEIKRIDKASGNIPEYQLPVTDLSHCTVLPPLVDCSVSLCLSATTDQRQRIQQETDDCQSVIYRIVSNLHYFHTHGVLAVGDNGDERVCLDYSGLSQEETKGVIVTSAGKSIIPVSAQGSAETGEVSEKLYDGSEAMGQFRNYLRIILTEQMHTNFSPNFPPRFSTDSLGNMVDIVDRQGAKIIIVANGEEAVTMALDAGCHAIEEGCGMGYDNLRRMSELQTAWIPVIGPVKQAEEMAGNTPVYAKRYESQLKQLSQAGSFGVKIVLGTGAGQCGVIHGQSMVEEMRYLQKAGFSLPQIIECATINGAELLQIDSIGELTAGAKANFIVSRGAPQQLPRKLSYLEGIYRNGHPCVHYRKNPVKTLYPWTPRR